LKYKYTAMNARNQKKEGAVEAETQSQAISILREKGLIVQDINEAGGSDEAEDDDADADHSEDGD